MSEKDLKIEEERPFDIPDTWKWVRIDSVADVKQGGTPKTKEPLYWDHGSIPWVTPADLSKNRENKYISHGDRFITEDGLKYSSAVLVPEKSIIYSSRAPIGYIAISQNELTTNQGCKSVIPNEKYVISDWIYYSLINRTEDIQQRSSGSTFSEISTKFFVQTLITLPPLPEQCAIASVLSSIDDKIDLLHRQNATLEAMAETLFKQWFVENPKDYWQETNLSSIADYLNGLPCQKYLPENDIDILPVLKIRELNNGIKEDSDFATSNIPLEYIVNIGDIIFSWSGSLLIKIWGGQNCVLNQHLFKVSSNTFPKWFYYLWTKEHLQDFISIAEAHATTMGHIKRKDLDESLVLVPYIKELTEMSEIMNPIFDKIINCLKEIQVLEKLRDTILPKLMSGEIRVKY